MPLDLAVGDLVTRAQLNAQYGGQSQGGIISAGAGKYAFLFSDPVPGRVRGYTFDGWLDESHKTFFYTGAGAGEDQEFIRGNRVIRDAPAHNRELHLFLAEGHLPGSGTRTHRYLGQFELSTTEPWRREPSQLATADPYTVIVFRLERSTPAPGPAFRSGRAPVLSPAPPATNTSSAVIPLEVTARASFTTSATSASTAKRREAAMVDRFVEYQRQHGVSLARNAITIAGTSQALFTDLWDDAALELYEAKGTTTRNAVRLAIGQLLDYRRHLTPPPRTCTVLLPTDPGEDLTRLITSVGFNLVYQDGPTFLRRP